MTTDADWLRARPEIAKALLDRLWTAPQIWNIEGATDLLAAALPRLRTAIREDVVREIASWVDDADPDDRMVEAAMQSLDMESVGIGVRPFSAIKAAIRAAMKAAGE